MLEAARVANAKDEARVEESKMRMNSPKKLKLDDQLGPHKVNVHPTNTGPEELELDGRSEHLKV